MDGRDPIGKIPNIAIYAGDHLFPRPVDEAPLAAVHVAKADCREVLGEVLYIVIFTGDDLPSCRAGPTR